MTALSLEAEQTNLIRLILNCGNVNLLRQIHKTLIAHNAEQTYLTEKEDIAAAKEENLKHFSMACEELAQYRKGNLKLKPAEDLLDEL